jgi:NADH-quinone oxidoreductase subunit C
MDEAPPPDDKTPPLGAEAGAPASAATAATAGKPAAPTPPAKAAAPASAPDAEAVNPAAPAAKVTFAADAATAPKAAAPAATAGKPAQAAAAGAAAAPKPAAAHPPTVAPPTGPPDPPPPAGVEPPAFIASLQAAIPGAVSQISYFVGDWTIIVPVAQIAAVARHLRDAPEASFDFCSDVTATDWPLRAEGRFDVVYCLYSTRLRHRIRVKIKVAESQPIPSATAIWLAADWLEREVWDLFGVNFTGHPDRRRILMPEDWQGFPQRKDYPLEGPGELLIENPLDWLKLRQARDEADIE